MRNLFQRDRRILSSWSFYNASQLPPKMIAIERDGLLAVKQKRLYRRIEQQAEEHHEESN